MHPLPKHRIFYFFISVLLIFFFIQTSIQAQSIQDQPGLRLRVGVFDNPPLTVLKEDGNWGGIAVDVLREIAEDHGWIIEIIPGNFAQLQNSLKKKEIDLLTPVAYSSERAGLYVFNHVPLISNWGIIYTQPDSSVKSVLDLEGKKVSVMKNNIHSRVFQSLMDQFKIHVELIEEPGFKEEMDAVKSGKADATVSNRLFGAVNSEKYKLVETGIIFNPINIHYASPDERYRSILSAIDEDLISVKSDKNSIYYKSIEKWMHGGKFNIPSWIYWLVYGMVGTVMFMTGIALLMRREVARKTKELRLEVEERRLAQARLDRMAYFDSLTGLPNRISFFETLKVAIGSARRNEKKVAVFFIDLDRFKTINDSLGHSSGDKILVEVARRLNSCLREEDSINRFGGDEFVAVLPEISDASDVHHVASRMLECMASPIRIGTTEFYSSLSIGIAMYPDDDIEIDGLLKDADAAMYHAKELGGNGYIFHNTEFTDKVKNRLELETFLRNAVRRNEFLLHYQPIFNLNDNALVGMEALIRWNHPELGLVYPDSFIPLAEENGMILPIGEWVIEKACAQLKSWSKKGLIPVKMSINISSRQFSDKHFVEHTASIMEKFSIHPSLLDFEITERMFMQLTQNVREVLNLFKEIGISLSIDDFGTGYSSLKYLKELPIDTLKIDKSFIRDIPGDKDDEQITNTIILMAHKMGLNVIAEGIETNSQLEYLLSQDCRLGQGYLFSKPIPPNQMEKLLKNTI